MDKVITEKQLTEFLKDLMPRQDELNSHLFDDWKKRDLDFLLAAKVEVGELADHLGYKWWKTNKEDTKQAFMEIVDILHFCLSGFMVKGISPEKAAKEVTTSLKYITNLDIFQEIHLLFKCCTFEFMLVYLIQIADSLGYTLEDIHKFYLGKYCLNKFRWNNNYGKSYIKTWFGKEDNEVLTVFLEQNEKVSEKDIYEFLEASYEKVKP